MKKVLALLLLAVMLSASLIACGETSDVSTGNTSKSDVSGEFVPDVPDVNYGGKEFKFLTAGVNQTANSEIVYNVYPDNQENRLPDVVNDALLNRMNTVEEQIGVKITEEYVFDAKRYGGAFLERLRADQTAGTVNYHVVVPCLYDAATLAAEDMLVDLNSGDIPYLDMTKPWWDQTFNDDMTINGKLFFTIGDIGLVNKDGTPCVAFNKQLIAEYDLESPYDLVDDGTWTIDKVIEMSKTFYNDDNQDGKMDYQDSFGYGGQYDDMWYMFYSSGARIAKRDADGWPIITIDDERNVAVIDKILELMQNKNYYISANDYFGVVQWPSELVTQAFVEGRSLFNLSAAATTESYRDMEDDWGLVPVPKYEASQEGYSSMVNPWVSNAFAVPKNLDDDTYEMIGVTLEVMGAFSKQTLAEAYYEIALVSQKTRDDDTIRMLDIIFASRGCDIGMIHKWGGLDTMLHELITKPTGSFASAYEAVAAKAEADLETTLDFYREMD